MTVQTRPGELGQFDVLLDGEVIAQRQRSLLARLLGGGWPSAETVIRAIDDRAAGGRG